MYSIHNYKYKNLKTVYYKFNSNEISESKSTIIFLHGVCADGLIIKNTLSELGKIYNVISIDLPGFGKSEVPEPNWNIQNYSEFILAFVDDFDLENVVLVGHSLGGLICLNTSILPSKIIKQIIIDSTGNLPHYSLPEYFYRLLVLENLYTITKYKKGFTKLLPFYLSYLYFFVDKFIYIRRITRIMQSCFYHDFNFYVKIKIPTVIFWGTDDILIPLKHGKILNEKIIGSKLIEVPGAHGWFKYNEDKLLTLLKENI